MSQDGILHLCKISDIILQCLNMALFHPALPRGRAVLVRGEEVNCVRNYELMYIIKPDVEEEKLTALVEKFKGLVEENGAEVTKLDKWGKRRLAYEVNHIKEGFYILMQFKAKPAAAAELDRVMKITDGILRHMIVREDE